MGPSQRAEVDDISPTGLANNTLEVVTLNKGTDEQLEFFGYKRDICKTILFWLLVVLSLGILLLVMYWKPEWRVYLTMSRCVIRRATAVLLKDPFGGVFVEEVVKELMEDGPYLYTNNSHGSRKSAIGEFTYLDNDSHDHMDDTTVLTVKTKLYMKYIDHKHVRYMWRKEDGIFARLEGIGGEYSCEDIHDKFKGLVPEEQAHKMQVYGQNVIDVQVKSYFKLFFQEILNPFYIFQICSVILWSLDDYYYYAGCIVFISAISLGVELYETRKQSQTLRDMVSAAETTVTVMRNNGVDTEEVETSRLVPGDVMLVPAKGCMMVCDAVLVSGNAIVNESMLTGESVPVTKTPLTSTDQEMFDPEVHKRHVLFCGTQVIQTRYYGDSLVKAVVVRTGFATAKGDLVRSILYPKPIGFKFYQDSIRFILILAGIAAVGMTYSIITLVKEGQSTKKVILRALDIITIVVPPALPAAMTVGTMYAQKRLKKQGIFCISPPRINICGKLKLICFDKTGTLTEDGLDMWGVVTSTDSKFDSETLDAATLPNTSHFVTAMATCHSLTIIDKEMTGDPLDLKMFNSLKWVLEEPGRDTAKFDSLMPTIVKPVTKDTYTDPAPDIPYEVGIVRQFTFSSGLQRMSVLTRVLGSDHMEIYTKGAPEKIASLCKKETIPDDFYETLQRFTKKGYRVIAMAFKPLESKLSWHQAQRVSRESVESELTFLGLLVMENAIKRETTPVIRQLQDAEIRTVMVTGDNMLTAISVARQCGMVQRQEKVVLVTAHAPEGERAARIQWEHAETDVATENTDNPPQTMTRDTTHGFNAEQPIPYHSIELDLSGKFHFALTGRTFGIIRQYFPQVMEKICVRGTIFARMSPDQKAQLVEHLQDLGYVVGMCGDGANDCGALKAAHAGISLSEAEASVASPFTSRYPNIECVPTVIREGRAALVTSFGVFKYMALYSMIQFVTVLILYTMGTNLGDFMFLYIDLVITTTVAVLMGYTAAYPTLVAKRPPGSLVSPGNIFSIMAHIILVAAFQTAAFIYLTMQPWYVPNTHAGSESIERTQTFESTVLFYTSAFQYLMMAYIFSKGPPYRKRIWHNVIFLVALVVLAGVTTLLVIYPFPFLRNLLKLVVIPSYTFKLTLLGMIAIHFLLATLVESFIVPSAGFGKIIKAVRRKREPKHRYKVIEAMIESNNSWPPIGEVTIATHESGMGSVVFDASINSIN